MGEEKKKKLRMAGNKGYSKQVIRYPSGFHDHNPEFSLLMPHSTATNSVTTLAWSIFSEFKSEH